MRQNGAGEELFVTTPSIFSRLGSGAARLALRRARARRARVRNKAGGRDRRGPAAQCGRAEPVEIPCARNRARRRPGSRASSRPPWPPRAICFTRASPMPWLRNTGSTMSGPRRSAGIPPMSIGVMEFAPTSRVPTRATKLSDGSGSARLANAIGGAGEPAGSEHTLVQPLDIVGVVAGFGFDDKGKVGHRLRLSIGRRRAETAQPPVRSGSRQARSNGRRQEWGAMS